ncbi:four helix bundle protein [Candidatus Microgenomates bacterium]|nr:four helix bundle protein [Candidatus Microgenomates bacterium]
MSIKAGYEYLLAWKITIPIYDYSVEFCKKYRNLLSSSRTQDQMVQAARSGSQNIAEGYKQESLQGYLKLTGVNRGSLEELLKDFTSFARQNKIEIWDKERTRREIGEIGVIWEILKKTPTLPDNPNFPYLPEDLTKCVNLMITLVNQANFLQDRLSQSLEQKFVKEGGFRENLFKKRMEYRNQKR